MNNTPKSTHDLDDALSELRERMADSGVMVGIIADLRRNSDRLKPMLADELRKLRTLLDEILPLLSMVALGILDTVISIHTWTQKSWLKR
jgi:hypothetical protein